MERPAAEHTILKLACKIQTGNKSHILMIGSPHGSHVNQCS